jgi:EmrB/QacA subfamily drug resistance transporter
MSVSKTEVSPVPDHHAPPGARWLGLLVAGAFFMENLDGTVITTALPQIAASFGVAPLELGIGVSAYLLTLGVFIPISGWVAERFGARRVFAGALALFTLASLSCGMAGSMAAFVCLRVLQGVGGAMMVPVGRQVVLRNTPKDRLVGTIATLTWPGLVAPVLGPPVGGFITTYANWRWIFYLNLPLGVAATVLALWLVPREAAPRRRPFDWFGFALGAAGISCLTWGGELLGRNAGLAQPLAFLAAGAVLLAFDIRHLRRAPHPLIDLGTLKVPTFAVTIFGGSLFRMAIAAVPFLLPLMFQIGFGLNAFQAGSLVIAVFGGNLAMKAATTSVLRRFGFRRVLLANGLINVGALAACALLTPGMPVWLIAAILFVGGMTRSMQFTALNTIAFADMPQAAMPAANTLFSTGFQVAMGLGVALGAIAVRLGHGLAALAGWQAVPAIDYRLAFLCIAAVSLAGLYDAARLPRDAGDHVARKTGAGAPGSRTAS